LSLTHYEFYCLTPKETQELTLGWQRRHARYLEGIRIIAHTIAQVNSTSRLPSMMKWMPLVTDNKDSIRKGPTADTLQAARDRIAAAKKRGGELLRIKKA